METVARKKWASVCAVILMAVILTSCAPHSAPDTDTSTASAVGTVTEQSGDILDKLRQIRSDWTQQQVFDLLGQPDRYGARNVVAEIFYTVDETKEAVIAFWSDGIKITVNDPATGEYTTIL